MRAYPRPSGPTRRQPSEGDSPLIIKLVSVLHGEGVRVGPAQVFLSPDVRSLAKALDERTTDGTSAGDPAAKLVPLNRRSGDGPGIVFGPPARGTVLGHPGPARHAPVQPRRSSRAARWRRRYGVGFRARQVRAEGLRARYRPTPRARTSTHPAKASPAFLSPIQRVRAPTPTTGSEMPR